MDTAEATVLSKTTTELIEFTWALVVKMRIHEATDIDVQSARDMARQLRALVEYYELYGEGLLSVTTIWLASEVAEAVDDISLKYTP